MITNSEDYNMDPTSTNEQQPVSQLAPTEPVQQQSVPPTPYSNPQETVISNVPDVLPDGFGLLEYSKRAVRTNLGTLFFLYVLYSVLSNISNVPGIRTDSNKNVVFGLLTYLLSILFFSAQAVALVKSVDGQKISLGAALSKGAGFYFKIFIAQILSIIMVAVGLLLLIVPGILLIPRIYLTEYFIVDKDMGPVEAIKASMAITKGNTGKVWNIIGVGILFAILFITIIGIPFSIYLLFMYGAAEAILYRYLTNKSYQESSATGTIDNSGSSPQVQPSPFV